MSFILIAPLPDATTTTVLPNPRFNDIQGRRLQVDLKRSMNNVKRTYVKSSDRQATTYTFLLSRMKGLELREFVLAYQASKIRWVDHRGDVWEGYFTRNPFEFSGAGRAAGLPGREIVEVTIQMEGERISYGPRNQC
jgi:hypothetical protein